MPINSYVPSARPGDRGTRDWFLNGSQLIRENIPRHEQTSNGVASPGTGVMLSTSIVLYAGDVVTNITFRSGSQAAVTPANWWFALYDTASTPALLGQTSDQTTTAWAANTNMTKALSSPVTITTSGAYYVSVMMAAATPVNFSGKATATAGAMGAIVTNQKVFSLTSGAALTTTAPATITSASTSSLQPYVAVS